MTRELFTVISSLRILSWIAKVLLISPTLVLLGPSVLTTVLILVELLATWLLRCSVVKTIATQLTTLHSGSLLMS